MPFTLIIAYFLTGSFAQYKIERRERKVLSPEVFYISYADLDRDGNSDEIVFLENSKQNASVYAKLGNRVLLAQWNMNGKLFSAKSCDVLDVDKDGFPEIVMLYFRNDSVFLSVFNPMDIARFEREDVFVDTIRFPGNPQDFSFSKFIVKDVANDSVPELLFAISSGFDLYPRNLYAYHVHSNAVMRSSYLALQLTLHEDMLSDDLDDDGNQEFLIENFAPGNMKSVFQQSIHDNSSWMIVLDKDLQFWTPPIEFKATPSYVKHHIIRSEGKKKVLFFCCNLSNKGDPSSIQLFDPIKKQIDGKLFLDDFSAMNLLASRSDDKSAVFYNQNGDLFEIGGDLQLRPAGNFCSKTSQQILAEIDIDGCGQKELILRDKDYLGFYVLRNDFSNPVFLPISSEPIHQFYEAMPLIENHEPVGFALHVNNVILKYSYTKNLAYWFQWPVYIMIFILISGIYYLIMKYYTRQIQEIYQKDKQIAELKLKSIRNQLDPHFTFNAFNAIASALYKEDSKTAYSYFAKFSKLMRATMLYSDKFVRLLNEEIDFTIQYLEIEKFRFRDKFNFEIDVDEDVVLSVEVPRMIIQAYAETSIANGLMHRDDGGLLTISLHDFDLFLEIRVTDNGVGIAKSYEYNKERAFQSVKIMDEFIGLINQMNSLKIEVTMEDLKNGEEILGTEVLIKIPHGLRYKLT